MGDNGETVSYGYALGLVNEGIAGTDVGGLMGFGSPLVVISSYWATDSSGQSASPGGGVGRLLDEMKQDGTFVGWGCEPVWTIDEGNEPPHLLWENASGVLITDRPAYAGGSGEVDDPF